MENCYFYINPATLLFVCSCIRYHFSIYFELCISIFMSNYPLLLCSLFLESIYIILLYYILCVGCFLLLFLFYFLSFIVRFYVLYNICW